MKNSPTIYDVAREAGVSIATVSRVLNNPHTVNPATLTHVVSVIERLAYVSLAQSQAKLSKAARRIGVLIPFFTEPSFTQRLRGIAGVLNQNNYELVIFPVDSKDREQSYLQTLPLRRSVDGLIIVSQAFDDEIARRLLGNKMEVVVIEYNDPRFSALEIDDVKGGSMATRFLVNKGHRRIAFIGGRASPTFGLDPIAKRLKGYRNTLQAAGLPIREELIYEYAMEPGAVLRQLAAGGLPLAIFAATDLQAIAIIKEARSMGLRIPQDVAIIGFDDIDMAHYFGLTTVHQPLDESGRIAASLLVSRLSDPSQTIQHIELPLTIVERETV